jgi:hypothetical protein
MRMRVECTLFYNLQGRARTHAVLVTARLVWVIRSNDLTHWATRAPIKLWKESLSSDGHQFHQYQQNEQSSWFSVLVRFLLINQTKKISRHLYSFLSNHLVKFS